jgi:hypothetical protein
MSATVHTLANEKERRALERQAEMCASSIKFVLANGAEEDFVIQLERAARLMTELARLLREWQQLSG